MTKTTNPTRTSNALALKPALAVAAMVLLVATSAAQAQGGNINPRVLPPNLFSKTGPQLLQLFPLPNINGQGFNYITQTAASNPQRQRRDSGGGADTGQACARPARGDRTARSHP